MNWIKELDKYGYNFLIDELVWHLEQGRIPTFIAKEKDDIAGFELRFERGKPYFLRVIPELLDKHWEEVHEITKRFPQLQNIKYVVR